MRRFSILLILLLGWLWAAPPVLHPARQIVADGVVEDMVLRDGELLLGTGHGSLQRVDLNDFKVTTLVTLKQIKDFMGDTIDAKVFSVDKNGDRYLLLSDSGQGGYSDLWILEGDRLKKMIGAEDQKALIKARFLDHDHVLLGSLSNEASLLDLKTGKELYQTQLTESKFSDFDLDLETRHAAFGCESGELTLIDAGNGKVLKHFTDLHVDNIFGVALGQTWLLAGGQDRRASYINLKTEQKGYFKARFLVYAVGLSPREDLAAYAMDEDNTITIYDLGTLTPRYRLHGQKSTLDAIVFLDETTLFSSSQDNTVMMWQLKP